MKDLISIIIPVYEAERTLRRCIDSVLAQTHEAIEVICIVDGSHDGSADILSGYAQKDPRLKIVMQANSGPATARNAGLDAAAGDFVGFVDADDFVDPSMYEVLLSAIMAPGPAGSPRQADAVEPAGSPRQADAPGPAGSPRQADAVEPAGSLRQSDAPAPTGSPGQHDLSGSAGSPQQPDGAGRADLANCGRKSFFPDGSEKTVPPGISGEFTVDGAAALGRLITGAPDFIWDKLFDARIIREKEIRFPDGRVFGEDTVFLAKYLSHVKTAVFLETPLYHYNAHSEGSITNTVSDRWYDIFENLKEIIYYFREQLDGADFAAVRPYLEELCIRYYDRRVNAMIRSDEKGFQIRYVKDSFEFLTMNFPDWKARMKATPDVVFPGVKTNLFLMRLFILAPSFLKMRYAERLVK